MSAFESLLFVYPQIIEIMPDEFDAHEFILKLAQNHQVLYVKMLTEYAENPFQKAHSQIAKGLNKHSELVRKIGEQNSDDIFRQVNSATVWQKMKK